MVNAALDDQDGEIVLRGVIDPDSLELLQVAEYQREVLPASTIKQLADAIRSRAGVPDIQLGMRGGQFTERNGSFYLEDPVYIVDGLQRRTAAMSLLKGGHAPRIGAVVYFNTTEESERLLFRSLNVSRVRLSPNVLLNNERNDSVTLEMLSQLCKEADFALRGRVCWQQCMARNHLFTASGLLRVTAQLHAQFGVIDGTRQSVGLAGQVDQITMKLKRSVVRQNVKTFFNTVDELWNIREVVYKERAPYLRMGFLTTLARVLSNHRDFWNDSELFVSAPLKRKLALFPLNDPQVATLCGAGGSSAKILYVMLVDHINSGKRTRRLVSFDTPEKYEPEEEMAAV